jgi:hypothetical protein
MDAPEQPSLQRGAGIGFGENELAFPARPGQVRMDVERSIPES